jgi:hypothetical protein
MIPWDRISQLGDRDLQDTDAFDISFNFVAGLRKPAACAQSRRRRVPVR